MRVWGGEFHSMGTSLQRVSRVASGEKKKRRVSASPPGNSSKPQQLVSPQPVSLQSARRPLLRSPGALAGKEMQAQVFLPAAPPRGWLADELMFALAHVQGLGLKDREAAKFRMVRRCAWGRGFDRGSWQRRRAGWQKGRPPYRG